MTDNLTESSARAPECRCSAIIVLENCNMDDIAVASETAIGQIPEGYVVAPLKIGEEMSLYFS